MAMVARHVRNTIQGLRHRRLIADERRLSKQTECVEIVAQALVNPTSRLPTEQGSRALVHAASQGPESHGQWKSNYRVAPFINNALCRKTENCGWVELSEKLEGI